MQFQRFPVWGAPTASLYKSILLRLPLRAENFDPPLYASFSTDPEPPVPAEVADSTTQKEPRNRTQDI